jgi:Cathelicidin
LVPTGATPLYLQGNDARSTASTSLNNNEEEIDNGATHRASRCNARKQRKKKQCEDTVTKRQAIELARVACQNEQEEEDLRVLWKLATRSKR